MKLNKQNRRLVTVGMALSLLSITNISNYLPYNTIANAETVNVAKSDGSIVEVNKLRVFVVKDRTGNITIEDNLKGLSHFFSTQQTSAESLGMNSVPNKLPIAPNKVNYGNDKVYEYYQVSAKKDMEFNYNILSNLTNEDFKGLKFNGVYKYQLDGNTLINGKKLNGGNYTFNSELEKGQHALVLSVSTDESSLTDSVDGLAKGTQKYNGDTINIVRDGNGSMLLITPKQVNFKEDINNLDCKTVYTTYGVYNIPKTNPFYNAKLDTNKDGVMCNLSSEPIVNSFNAVESSTSNNVITDSTGGLPVEEFTPHGPTKIPSIYTDDNNDDNIDVDTSYGGVNPNLPKYDGKVNTNPIEYNKEDDNIKIIDLGDNSTYKKEGNKLISNISNPSINNSSNRSNSANNSMNGNNSVNTNIINNAISTESPIEIISIENSPIQQYNEVYSETLPDSGQKKLQTTLYGIMAVVLGSLLIYFVVKNNKKNKDNNIE